jgi:hypothetical protein
VDRLAGHQAAVDHEDEHHGVELERRALEPSSQGQVGEDPAIVEPVSHDGIDAERGGDRCALEVLALACGILGEHSDRYVESSKSGQTAEHEEGEADGVEGRAKTDREGGHGRGDAKRDLRSHR